MVTANRLTDGAVIYRTVDGDWTTDLAQAAVVSAPAAAELLRARRERRRARRRPYVAPVDLAPNRACCRATCVNASALRAPLSRCPAPRPEADMYVYDEYDWAFLTSASPNFATRCAAACRAS